MTKKELQAELDALKAEVAGLRFRVAMAECRRVEYVPYPVYPRYFPQVNPWPYMPAWGSGNISVGLGDVRQNVLTTTNAIGALS